MELVGAGSYGLVHLLDSHTVLKTPYWRNDDEKPGAYEDLERELTLLRLIQQHGGHPNIVKYLGSDTANGVMLEYLPNGTLEGILLHNKDLLTVGNQLKWIQHIVQAALFLYSIGYAHGDLRPANLLFDSQGMLKVCDFGASVPLGGSVYAPHVPYWDGTSDCIDQKEEQFRMSSLLYTIVCGEEPFAKYEVNEAIDLIRRCHFPDTSSWSSPWTDLGNIISKGWHKDYTSFSDYLQDIQSFVEKSQQDRLGDSNV